MESLSKVFTVELLQNSQYLCSSTFTIQYYIPQAMLSWKLCNALDITGVLNGDSNDFSMKFGGIFYSSYIMIINFLLFRGVRYRYERKHFW